MNKNTTCMAIKRVLCGFTLYCFITSSQLLAQPSPWTYKDIRKNDSSPCYAAFDNEQDISAEICRRCASFINDNAQLRDRGSLFQELSTKNCTPKQEPNLEKQETGWSFYLDQDYLTLDSWTDLNDDRNYTMGFGFSQSGKKYSEGFMAAGRNWFDHQFSIFDSKRHAKEQIHSSEYGLTAFTPNELEIKEPIAGDRPYASLVYLSNSKIRAYLDKQTVKSKWVIGILGLDIAKAVQRYLHNEVGVSSQDPLGWDNQISEGGEPTMLYSVEQITLLTEHLSEKNIDWDISYTTGANAGYYADLYAGADIRIGRITSPYYSHNANPLSIANHGNCFDCRNNDNFVFASYRARLVAYNALLQGQFRNSEITFSGSDIERLLHEASVGWAYQFSPTWQFTYALSYKSKEYNGVEERAHWFAGLYISKNFE